MATWMGHLGPRIADLLDGRLDAAEEERAWAHVDGCPSCFDQVNRAGWVKSRLGSMAAPGEAPSTLKGCLLQAPGGFGGFDPSRYGAPAGAEAVLGNAGDRTHRRGLIGLAAAIGTSAAGAAVVGLLTVGASPAQAPASVDRRPATVNRQADAPTQQRSQHVGVPVRVSWRQSAPTAR